MFVTISSDHKKAIEGKYIKEIRPSSQEEAAQFGFMFPVIVLGDGAKLFIMQGAGELKLEDGAGGIYWMPPETKPRFEEFIVSSVSENTNSFGLRGMILVSRKGAAWQVGANYIDVKKKGEVLGVPILNDEPQWHKFSFEIPERLPDCPPAAIAEVWKT